MKRLLWFLSILVVVLGSCSIPFSVETEPAVITLPVQTQAASIYDEESVAIPEQARRDAISYDRVRIYYQIHTDSIFTARVQIWISDPQTADGSLDETSEKVIDVEISGGDSVSGWTDSVALRAALNARNERFVVGGVAQSLIGGGTVKVTVHAEISGTVNPAR